MSQPLLSEGEFVHEDEPTDRDRVEELEAELMQARRELATLRQQVIASLRGLVGTLGNVDAPATQSAKWETIKQRLTAKQGAIIDLLNVQGEMTTSQLAAATKSSGEGTRQMLDKLRSQGLIEKNGTLFKLKDR